MNETQDRRNAAANPQWGGRFAAGPSVVMQEINASISFDQKLWRQDISGSLAHAAMLAKVGVITTEDEQAIGAGLAAIAQEIETGRFPFDVALEDIHMNIEARLTERIGEAGRRLHTARSRNDQVATDFRLWVRDAIDGLGAQITDVMRALADRAAEHAGDPMPGFTHLQTAQPVTFGHHLLAYVEMLDRDRGRLAGCRRRLNECPLGSAALAGTSFPIDRHMTAKALGFDRPTANSLDAVSDRDFALGVLERRRDLRDASVAFCRGDRDLVFRALALHSPQRRVHHGKFDHAAEAQPRCRGTGAGEERPRRRRPCQPADRDEADCRWPMRRTCRRTRNRCSTRRKPGRCRSPRSPAWRARIWRPILPGCANLPRPATRPPPISRTGWVRKLKLPFRDAHHLTGRLVAMAESKGVDLADLPLADMQSVEARITADVFSVLTVEASVASRTCFGGTAPANVAREAGRWQAALA